LWKNICIKKTCWRITSYSTSLISLLKKSLERLYSSLAASKIFFDKGIKVSLSIRDVEYEVILDLAFEALEYDDIVLVNAPFTKEIRDLNYVKQTFNIFIPMC